MMNTIFVGNTTVDVTVRENNGAKFVSGAICNQRGYKAKDGTYPVDFFNFTASGKTAEFIEKHFAKKGSPVVMTGQFRNEKYTNKDGNEVTATKFYVESVNFVPGGKSANDTSASPADAGSFVPVPDEIDEELPFN